MVERFLRSKIKKQLGKGKVIVLVGARQVGKTTLIEEIFAEAKQTPKTVVFNGDNLEAQKLSKMSSQQIKQAIGDSNLLLIDEAHKINRIGDIVKSLVDDYGAKLQIVLTGSSTINLIDKTAESLTGRKRVFELYPITLAELPLDILEIKQNLNQLLLYGLYPEVINATDAEDKKDALVELAQSSVYRDVLDVTGIRASGDLVALLRYLANNVGQTLSINEASSKLSIDRRTIDRYIELLAKSYIVFPLQPYSKRGSISRAYKVYFWDVGIRNALAEDLTPIEQRPDINALWQNFVIAEYIKQASYQKKLSQFYFWKSYDGTEMDLIKIEGQNLTGYKISYQPKHQRTSQVFQSMKPAGEVLVSPDSLGESGLLQL